MENAIYKMLIDRDMTQAELARKVGVKREYINRIINRKITPTIPLGSRIAKALGMKVEDVFFEERGYF
jgi:putative transcriptional regulator